MTIVGALLLQPVRQLLGADAGELGRGHARPAQGALRLQHRARPDHGHGVDAPVAAGLEQERHVEHDQLAPRPGRPGAGSAPGWPGPAGGRWPPADAARRAARAPPCPARLRSMPPAEPRQPGNAAATGATASPPGANMSVHLGVGVEHRHAEGPEAVGGPALAHGDRPGEAEQDHVSSTPWSRRNWSSGRSGIPSTVAWAPSTRAISWAPRPSSW